jgi:hypothetical protein
MNHNLGIRLRPKPVAGRKKLVAQFGGVEHFAVIGDPDRLVLIGKRLVAPGQVYDAQTAGGESNPAVGITTPIIRPAMVHQIISLEQACS